MILMTFVFAGDPGNASNIVNGHDLADMVVNVFPHGRETCVILKVPAADIDWVREKLGPRKPVPDPNSTEPPPVDGYGEFLKTWPGSTKDAQRKLYKQGLPTPPAPKKRGKK